MSGKKNLTIGVGCAVLLASGWIASQHLPSSFTAAQADTSPVQVDQVVVNRAIPKATPATPSTSNPGLDYTSDEPLPPAEEKQFLAEVVEVFSVKAASFADPNDLSQYLSDLNVRQRRGARSIRNRLESTSQNDAEAKEKMAYVDYLTYRAKWDPSVRDDIVAIATAPVDSISDTRLRATRIAEDAELIKGLVYHDFQKAIANVAALPDGTQKSYELTAIHDALYNQGFSWAESTKKISQFVPGYERKAK